MKLSHNHETATNEIYNIKTDIGEKNNLMGTSKEYDKISLRLAKVLSEKLRDDNDTMTVIK